MTTVEQVLAVKGPDVIVASSSTTVLEAAKLMSEANVGSVVVREEGQVLGIFTERDLLRRVVAHKKDPSQIQLQEVMSSPVKICRLNDDIRDCAEQLTRTHIRHLAVTEDDALVGLISFRDVLTAQVHDAERRTEPV